MTWTNLASVFGYGSKLTAAQMQNLRDNITALANHDSGAPSIQGAALALNIGDTRLNTSTNHQYFWEVLGADGAWHQCSQKYDNDVQPPSTCFISGSLVLMSDGFWKTIETVKAGDLVQGVHGPVVVDYLDVTTLGDRRMMSFKDKSCTWSEEHLFWSRIGNGEEWWWSANPDQWRREVAMGVVPGLKNNMSVRDGRGSVEVEFAHMDGFKKREVIELKGWSHDTPLYLPVTKGSPIIVDGYVVAALANEKGFDYTKIKWVEGLKKIKATLK
jgi:hypothetical protein